MKRWQVLAMIGSMPLMLLGVVWQAGRQASLVAEARELEHQQESWVEANAKLIGGISVLENRERANELASKLGLERATAERRIFIETQPSKSTSDAAAPAPTQAVKGNG
ncbi:MAG TPA: hypothetical protein VMV44_06080 [Rectinemataceae bacterium]|nr:hypothetical protein [Rectinemataceae bacterium]